MNKRNQPVRLNSRQAAFTLVELLVVVTIIVVLLALLTPSLEKAVAVAQAAVCMSNEHQIGNGLGHYLYEYRRAYPYPFAISPDAVKDPAYHGASPETGWPATPVQQRLLPFVGRSIDLFVCPSDPDPSRYNFWHYQLAPDFDDDTDDALPNNADSDPADIGRSSYMFSAEATIGIPAYEDAWFKASEIVDPVRFGYMADGHIAGNGWWWQTLDPTLQDTNDFWSYRIHWTHDSSVNVLTGDLSVLATEQHGINDEIRSHPLKNDRPERFGF